MNRVFSLIGIVVVIAILFDPVWSVIKQIKGTNTALMFMQGVMAKGREATMPESDPGKPRIVEISISCPDYQKAVAATAKDLGGEMDTSKIPCPTGL